MIKKIFLILASLSLSACTFQFFLPAPKPAGPTVTDQILVPLPTDPTQTMDVSLDFGAGVLKINPGATELVSGTATYNVDQYKPEVTATATGVKIAMGDWDWNTIPNVTDIKNEWDLRLGPVPMNLNIDAGAYQARFELGGLALSSLNISDGASDVELKFSSPNLADMSVLHYETGASSVSLGGLGNANFETLYFKSGAGDYTLDFSGQLQRAATVSITTGVSNITLVIPSGVPALVTVTGGLSNVNYDPQFSASGNVYSQGGTGPQLTIQVEIGAGNLNITN